MKPRYKPLDRPECEDTWFCYIVPKRGKGRPSALNKAASQVPDLNHGKTGLKELDPPKVSNRCRPGPEDSKYIRLAKAGGRKNLLEFRESPRKKEEPLDYPITEWYYDTYEEMDPDRDQEVGRKTCKKTGNMSTSNEREDWMTHVEFASPLANKDSTRKLRRPIIGFDALSTWKREELEDKLNNKAPTNDTIRFQLDSQVKSGKSSKDKDARKTSKLGTTRLPKLVEPPSKRKLSGADLAVRWYDKWYVATARG